MYIYFLDKLVQYATKSQSQLQDCSTHFRENQNGYWTYSNYQLETEKWIVFCHHTWTFGSEAIKGFSSSLLAPPLHDLIFPLPVTSTLVTFTKPLSILIFFLADLELLLGTVHTKSLVRDRARCMIAHFIVFWNYNHIFGGCFSYRLIIIYFIVVDFNYLSVSFLFRVRGFIFKYGVAWLWWHETVDSLHSSSGN